MITNVISRIVTTPNQRTAALRGVHEGIGDRISFSVIFMSIIYLVRANMQPFRVDVG